MAGKKWIQGAIKHPGSFTKYAKSQGMSMSEAIQTGKKSDNPTVRKKANLAQTLRKISKGNKKSGNGRIYFPHH